MPRFSLSLARTLPITLAILLAMAGNPSLGASLPAASALDQAVEQARLSSWRSLIEQGSALGERSKLQTVNDFINRSVSYGSDREIWGADEYWATPAQTLARGRGDCEDFAIGKYFTLVEMGVPSEKLRLTFVKALALNQAHMVLAYYPSQTAQPLILDNLEPQIKPAGERRDLLPVYAFNNHGIFLAKQPQQKSAQSPQLLSRWSDVSERVLADERRQQANQG
ncbi:MULTISPECIES: transglutaminase-like cysteine peptidase [unclassified Pseudomonas]|uniref:transglutaminase-like cysteine peptidase n=1 Tax=unclassified Pseudomonas TaxID=196821 RepID=UPI001EDFCDDB|nr:transglutaminase-like cysteine peptidase [Pseudomonas sp. MMS21 TM103]MCG4451767.1 transglutaminase-like cysteine peptidase [Pseudomonas sp. MMS21 TM103]